MVLFLAWALQLVPTIMMAQDVVEVVDSANVDPLEGMLIEVYDNEDGVEVRDRPVSRQQIRCPFPLF